MAQPTSRGATQIQTPELKLASSVLTNLLEMSDKGLANIQQGKLVVGASNGMCRVVKTDLDRRLAAPKLARIEEQIDDHSRRDAA